MAALSPGTVVIYTPPIIVGEYFPNPGGRALGSASIHTTNGYVYTPPVIGQVWPRGDYAPM